MLIRDSGALSPKSAPLRHSRTTAVLRLESAAGILAPEESFSGLLAEYHGLGGSVIVVLRVAGGRVVAFGNAGSADAAICIRGEHSPRLVHGHIVEVQQVTWLAGTACAVHADRAELYRIVGSRIYGEPALPAIIGSRNIGMPHTVEWNSSIGSCSCARLRRAQEEEGGAVVVSSYNLGEGCVVKIERYAHVLISVPGTSLVVRYGNAWMSITVHVTEVDASFCPDSN